MPTPSTVCVVAKEEAKREAINTESKSEAFSFLDNLNRLI